MDHGSEYILTGKKNKKRGGFAGELPRRPDGKEGCSKQFLPRAGRGEKEIDEAHEHCNMSSGRGRAPCGHSKGS